jgi:hypothetical protein
VISFNLCYDNPGDGVDRWSNRKERVAALIRYHGADVIGVSDHLPVIAVLGGLCR